MRQVPRPEECRECGGTGAPLRCTCVEPCECHCCSCAVVAGVQLMRTAGGHAPDRQYGLRTNGPQTVWWREDSVGEWHVCPERSLRQARAYLRDLGREVLDAWRAGLDLAVATDPDRAEVRP